MFGEGEQEKLENRAQRFGFGVEPLSSEDIQSLYHSLGLETSLERADVCFDTIHMHGVTGLTTHDIFCYFGRFEPSSVHWISKQTCNVIWQDHTIVMRAMAFLSKSMSSRGPTSSGRSILLCSPGADKENSQVDWKLPPGRWRLGDPYGQNSRILMRLAKRSDVQVGRKRRASAIGVDKSNPWGCLAQEWDNDVREHVWGEQSSETTRTGMGPSRALLERLGDPSESKDEPDAKKSKGMYSTFFTW